MQHVLWPVHDLCCFSSLRNVVILCGTNDLYQDSPEDIANGLMKLVSCFKQGNNAINVFICDILAREDISLINRLLRNHVNFIDLCKPSLQTNFIDLCKLTLSNSVNYLNFNEPHANWIQMVAPLHLIFSIRISCTWWKKEMLF